MREDEKEKKCNGVPKVRSKCGYTLLTIWEIDGEPEGKRNNNKIVTPFPPYECLLLLSALRLLTKKIVHA